MYEQLSYLNNLILKPSSTLIFLLGLQLKWKYQYSIWCQDFTPESHLTLKNIKNVRIN